jgi:hypothetical protein
VVFIQQKGGRLDEVLSNFPIASDFCYQQLKKWKIQLRKGEEKREKMGNHLFVFQKWRAYTPTAGTYIYRFKIKIGQ